MKTYAEWLEEFKLKIVEGYERHRMDRCLSGFVSEVERTAKRLIKLSGPIVATFGIPESGELPPPIVPTTREVTPLNAGFIIDMREWAVEPERWGMNMFMTQLGEIIAERESFIIVKGMLDNAGNTIEAENKGKLSKTDIRKAEDWIRANETSADTLIMHIEQEMEFRRKGELLEASRIPTGYVPDKERGRHYSGWLDGLNVYWTRFTKGVAIVYGKREIMVRNTPLKIYFDNIDRPSKLILERWCSAAPIIDVAVVKIIL